MRRAAALVLAVASTTLAPPATATAPATDPATDPATADPGPRGAVVGSRVVGRSVQGRAIRA